MIGEKIDKRRIFTPEERQQILKNTYGICACCGKKLTNKTMRVEHIIPLSRGGKNEMANLTALCESCNTLKDNKIYMPYDFYSALRDKPRFHEMEHYVRDWFQTIKDDFDLERFPQSYLKYKAVCPYNTGLKGNMTEWGSTIDESPYRIVLAAVDWK